MQIRILRMTVRQRRERMEVGLLPGHRHPRQMIVLVVLVVAMRVLVRERRVDVLVVVLLGEMQPDAGGQRRGQRLPQRDDTGDGR
jgi:hypothetical protein